MRVAQSKMVKVIMDEVRRLRKIRGGGNSTAPKKSEKKGGKMKQIGDFGDPETGRKKGKVRKKGQKETKLKIQDDSPISPLDRKKARKKYGTKRPLVKKGYK